MKLIHMVCGVNSVVCSKGSVQLYRQLKVDGINALVAVYPQLAPWDIHNNTVPLAAIGMNTSFSSFRRSGARPMLHGFIISALVVVVALLVEICMGIV